MDMCAGKCEYGRRTQTVMMWHQLIAFAFSLCIYLDKSNYLRNRITYRWTIIHPATHFYSWWFRITYMIEYVCTMCDGRPKNIYKKKKNDHKKPAPKKFDWGHTSCSIRHWIVFSFISALKSVNEKRKLHRVFFCRCSFDSNSMCPSSTNDSSRNHQFTSARELATYAPAAYVCGVFSRY